MKHGLEEKSLSDAFEAGRRAGRAEALTRLKCVIEDAIEFQKKDLNLSRKIKYRLKGIPVERPLLPGLKESLNQIRAVMKAFSNEETIGD